MIFPAFLWLVFLFAACVGCIPFPVRILFIHRSVLLFQIGKVILLFPFAVIRIRVRLVVLSVSAFAETDYTFTFNSETAGQGEKLDFSEYGLSFFLPEGFELKEVVKKTVTSTTTSVIYSVACSDSVYAWVELDMITRSWSLFASAFSNGALTGETKTLWQADSNWDPAPVACSGTSVIWQVQPSTSGNKTAETSYCYLWTVGSSDAQAVVESPGRFATTPTVCGDWVVLAPRVRASEGTYYGVTAYTVDDGLKTKVDQIVMPASVKPFRACRMGEKFVVSVEANYSSGGLLGNMGTYIGSSDGSDFLYLSREPFECAAAGKNGIYFIKSRSSYIVVNANDQTYSVLSSVDRSVDYGEYPARVGECNTFATFSSVKDATTGYPASVIVRTFPL